MMDVLYVALTIAFFALMLGYVRACEKLSKPEHDNDGRGL